MLPSLTTFVSSLLTGEYKSTFDLTNPEIREVVLWVREWIVKRDKQYCRIEGNNIYFDRKGNLDGFNFLMSLFKTTTPTGQVTYKLDPKRTTLLLNS
jgi:hypothetical protein